MKRHFFRRGLVGLCLTAWLAGVLTVPVGAGQFQDVPESHWAAEAIARCAAQGWLQGRSADTFGVGQPMTRAGFAVALSRFFGWESQGAAYQIFSDVPENAWYEPALRACYEHGAVTRQTADFRPGDAITREELAVMLIRALGYGQLAGLAEEDALPFQDVSTNRGHIAMAYEMGLSSGISKDRFAPDRTATREQAAVMLTRLADKWGANMAETMAIFRAGEPLTNLVDCETAILMAGTLTGGQSPRLTPAGDADAWDAAKTAAKEAGCRVLLGVSGQSGVLKNGTAAGTALAAAVAEGGYDGVYLSIFQSAQGEGRELAAFVSAVRAELPETLVYVEADAPTRSQIKDYTALGKTADRLVLRVPACQDTQAAVPVLAMEPLENIYYALSVLNDQVPADKLALYLTAEGQARKGGKTSGLEGEEVAALAEKGTVYYSDRYDCAYLQTKDTTVWYLNEEAWEARCRLLHCFGVSAVCLSTANGTVSFTAGAASAGT